MLSVLMRRLSDIIEILIYWFFVEFSALWGLVLNNGIMKNTPIINRLWQIKFFEALLNHEQQRFALINIVYRRRKIIIKRSFIMNPKNYHKQNLRWLISLADTMADCEFEERPALSSAYKLLSIFFNQFNW